MSECTPCEARRLGIALTKIKYMLAARAFDEKKHKRDKYGKWARKDTNEGLYDDAKKGWWKDMVKEDGTPYKLWVSNEKTQLEKLWESMGIDKWGRKKGDPDYGLDEDPRAAEFLPIYGPPDMEDNDDLDDLDKDGNALDSDDTERLANEPDRTFDWIDRLTVDERHEIVQDEERLMEEHGYSDDWDPLDSGSLSPDVDLDEKLMENPHADKDEVNVFDQYPPDVASMMRGMMAGQFFTSSWAGTKEAHEDALRMSIDKRDLEKFGLTPTDDAKTSTKHTEIYLKEMRRAYMLSGGSNQAYRKFSDMWDHLVLEHRGFRKMAMEGQAAANILHRIHAWRTENKTISRATDFDNLDAYLEKGVTGGEGKNYNYTAASHSAKMTEEWARHFDRHVIVSFTDVADYSHFVPYTIKPPRLRTSTIIGEGNTPYLDRPMPGRHFREQEVRLSHGMPLKNGDGESRIQYIEIFKVPKGETYDGFLEKVREKYGSLVSNSDRIPDPDRIFYHKGAKRQYEYRKSQEAKPLSASSAIKIKSMLYQLKARKFDESKHKRDKDGKFSSQGGKGLKFKNIDYNVSRPYRDSDFKREVQETWKKKRREREKEIARLIENGEMDKVVEKYGEVIKSDEEIEAEGQVEVADLDEAELKELRKEFIDPPEKTKKRMNIKEGGDFALHKEFSKEFTEYLKKEYRATAVPRADNFGHAWLTDDGKWVEGEESHEGMAEITMSNMSRKGIGLHNKDEPVEPGDVKQILVAEHTQNLRIQFGTKKDKEINIQIYHPLTHSQKKAIKDYITSNDLYEDDVHIEFMGNMSEMREDLFRRSLTGVLLARKFDESKHVRDEDGQFANKGGGSDGTKEGKKPYDIDFDMDGLTDGLEEVPPKHHINFGDKRNRVDENGNFVPEPDEDDGDRIHTYRLPLGWLKIKPGENVLEKMEEAWGKPWGSKNGERPNSVDFWDWDALTKDQKMEMYDAIMKYGEDAVKPIWEKIAKKRNDEVKVIKDRIKTKIAKSFDASHADITIEDNFATENFEQVELIGKVWNNIPFERRGHIKHLEIKSIDGTAWGTFEPRTLTVTIDPKYEGTEEEMVGVVEHECGHGTSHHWPKEQKKWYRREIRERDIKPIDSYAQFHLDNEPKAKEAADEGLREIEFYEKTLRKLKENPESEMWKDRRLNMNLEGTVLFMKNYWGMDDDDVLSGELKQRYMDEIYDKDDFAGEMYSIYLQHKHGKSGGKRDKEKNVESMKKMDQLIADMEAKFGKTLPSRETTKKGKVTYGDISPSGALDARKYDETKHERDEAGKYTNKGGGDSSKSRELKFKNEDRKEKPDIQNPDRVSPKAREIASSLKNTKGMKIFIHPYIKGDSMDRLKVMRDVWNETNPKMLSNVKGFVVSDLYNGQYGVWIRDTQRVQINLALIEDPKFEGREIKHAYRNVLNHELGHSILASYPEKHKEFKAVLIKLGKPYITNYVMDMEAAPGGGEDDITYIDETFAEFVKLYNDPTKTSWEPVRMDGYRLVEQAVRQVFGDPDQFLSRKTGSLDAKEFPKPRKVKAYKWDYGLESVYWLDADGEVIQHRIMNPEEVNKMTPHNVGPYLRELNPLNARAYDETKHVRDEDGQYTHKGGGGDEPKIDMDGIREKLGKPTKTLEYYVTAGNDNHTMDENGNFVPNPDVKSWSMGKYSVHGPLSQFPLLAPGENVQEMIDREYGVPFGSKLLGMDDEPKPFFITRIDWDNLTDEEKLDVYDMVLKHDGTKLGNVWTDTIKAHRVRMGTHLERTKKDILASFDNSHASITISDDLDLDTVKQISKTWNAIPFERRGFVKHLRVKSLGISQFGKPSAQFNMKDSGVTLDRDQLDTTDDAVLIGTLEHECAHSVEYNWPKEQRKWFGKELREREIEPVDSYAQEHYNNQDEFRKTVNGVIEDIEKFTKRIQELDEKGEPYWALPEEGTARYYLEYFGMSELDAVDGSFLKKFKDEFEDLDSYASETHSIYLQYIHGTSSESRNTTLNQESMRQVGQLIQEMEAKFGKVVPSKDDIQEGIRSMGSLTAAQVYRLAKAIHQLKGVQWNEALNAALKKFDETKHRRDEEGKFAEKEGGVDSRKLFPKIDTEQTRIGPDLKIRSRRKSIDRELDWPSHHMVVDGDGYEEKFEEMKKKFNTDSETKILFTMDSQYNTERLHSLAKAWQRLAPSLRNTVGELMIFAQGDGDALMSVYHDFDENGRAKMEAEPAKFTSVKLWTEFPTLEDAFLSTFTHEAGHVRFIHKTDEEQIAYYDDIYDLPPLTDYTANFKESIKIDYSEPSRKFMRDEINDLDERYEDLTKQIRETSHEDGIRIKELAEERSEVSGELYDKQNRLKQSHLDNVMFYANETAAEMTRLLAMGDRGIHTLNQDAYLAHKRVYEKHFGTESVLANPPKSDPTGLDPKKKPGRQTTLTAASKLRIQRIQIGENVDSVYYMDGRKVLRHALEPHKKPLDARAYDETKHRRDADGQYATKDGGSNDVPVDITVPNEGGEIPFNYEGMKKRSLEEIINRHDPSAVHNISHKIDADGNFVPDPSDTPNDGKYDIMDPYGNLVYIRKGENVNKAIYKSYAESIFNTSPLSQSVLFRPTTIPDTDWELLNRKQQAQVLLAIWKYDQMDVSRAAKKFVAGNKAEIEKIKKQNISKMMKTFDTSHAEIIIDKSVDYETMALIHNAWNAIPYERRHNAETLRIEPVEYFISKQFGEAAGYYDPTNKTVVINSKTLSKEQKVVRGIVEHEVGHSIHHGWDDDRKDWYRSEFKRRNIQPIDPYTKSYHDDIRRVRGIGQKIKYVETLASKASSNVESAKKLPLAKKYLMKTLAPYHPPALQIERGDLMTWWKSVGPIYEKGAEDMYANEMHSALLEHTHGTSPRKADAEQMQRVKKLLEDMEAKFGKTTPHRPTGEPKKVLYEGLSASIYHAGGILDGGTPAEREGRDRHSPHQTGSREGQEIQLSAPLMYRTAQVLYQLQGRQFDESKHKRDEDGKFSTQGGKGKGLKFKNEDVKDVGFEKIWKSKYAKKWDDLIKNDIDLYSELKLGYPTSNPGVLKQVRNAFWIKDNIDKVNKILGTNYAVDDRGLLRTMSLEERKEVAEFMTNAIPDEEFKPEDFEDSENVKEIFDNNLHLGYSWDMRRMLGEVARKHNLLHAIQVDIEDALIKNPEKFQGVVDKDISEYIEQQAEIDAVMRKRYENATAFFRGTDDVELHHLIESGGILGAGKHVDEEVMPGGGEYSVSTSINKRSAIKFAKGLVIEFPKDKYSPHADYVDYNLFTNAEYHHTGTHAAKYLHEEEYTFEDGVKINPKDIKLHMRPWLIERIGGMDEVKRKYKDVGEIIVVKEKWERYL